MTITGVGSVTTASVYAGGEHVAYDGGAAAAPVEFETAAATVSLASASEASASKRSEDADIDGAELEKIMEEPVRQANKALQVYDRRIEREVHAVTKTIMYTIRDTRTNEVIAEYPSRKVQDMIAKMWELAGLFIDQKA